MNPMRRLLLSVLAAGPAALSLPVRPAGAVTTEVHGSSDAYGEAGVALAWAVRRGADERSTQVVLRIVVDPVRYPRLAIVGRDPFGGAEHVLLAPAVTTGRVELAIPRAHFADFPRTEIRLHAPGAGGPTRVIYYLGVPDTTPEFASEPALDAYLADRITRVRRPEGNRP
jgi:hypothetical protein